MGLSGDPSEAPAAARDRLLAALEAVPAESVPLAAAAGRVLAAPLTADRDSPPHDASAMDGFALRVADFANPLPIAGELRIGRPPVPLPPGAALRIGTGACVPPEADAVVPIEDVVEVPGDSGPLLQLRPGVDLVAGQYIRRRGENLRAGAAVLPGGRVIDSALAGALAAFGKAEVRVTRRLTVTVLVTGDELLPVAATPAPYQLRDSNGPALACALAREPLVTLVRHTHVADDAGAVTAALSEALAESDVVVLTGGVSVGAHDHVAGAVASTGCRTCFHRLPIRPGRPVLGAVGPQGQAVLGLPGNPLAVLVCARYFLAPALRRRAGAATPVVPPPLIELVSDDTRTLRLHWFRPVLLVEAGKAELVSVVGSGDVAGPASSDGFVRVPPGESSGGAREFYGWG